MRINCLKRLALLTTALLWVASSNALERNSPFSGGVEENSEGTVDDSVDEAFFEGGLGWSANFGLSVGGDKAEDAGINNNAQGQGPSISAKTEAGGKVLLAAGLRYEFSDMPFEARLNVGFQSDGLLPSEDVTFRRFPIELLGFYKLGKHRLGGGLTLHLSPKLEFEFEDTDVSAKYDNATGLVLQYDYYILQDISLGARFVTIDYEKSDAKSLDGDHIGAIVQYYF